MTTSKDGPACPLCRAPGAREAGHYPAAAQTLYRCTSCTFRFVHPHTPVIPGLNDPIAEDKSASFWAGREVEEAYETWRAKENARQFGIVEDLIAANSVQCGAVLEIGFGPGALARRLGRKFERYYGIEPVQSYVDDLAQAGFEGSRLYASGVEAVLLDGGPLAAKSGMFDVIIMVSVFEHISRPLEILEICRRLLTPNGVLLLSTPDSSLFGVYYALRKTLRMEPWTRFHISFFTETSLGRAFARSGLRLVARENCPLVTADSARYFGLLQKNKFLEFAMNAARLAGIPAALRLNSVFYGLRNQ